jgi:hypothetical protein
MSTPTPGTPQLTPAAAPSPAIPQGAGTPLPPPAPSRQAPSTTGSSSGTGTFGVRIHLIIQRISNLIVHEHVGQVRPGPDAEGENRSTLLYYERILNPSSTYRAV